MHLWSFQAITEQANKTIVIQPGSSQLRIGRAWDANPVTLPHVIAWRHKAGKTPPRMKLLRSNGVLIIVLHIFKNSSSPYTVGHC